MSFYSLPYLLLILIYVFIYFYEKSPKQLIDNSKTRFFCAIIFIFYFGFRGFIGSDWLNYERYYSETSLSSWTVFDYEIGFSFFVKLFHDLGFSYEFFVLVITSFQVFLWNRFFKRESKNISLAYIILIAIFPLLVIDLLRNFTAILIAIQSIEYINQNKKIKAILIILASISFHLTGIFFFFLFLLKRNYLKKSILIGFFVFGIIIYFLQIRVFDTIIFSVGQFLGGRFEYLANSVVNSSKSYGLRWGILEKIFFMILVLINYHYIVKNKLISPLYFNAFFCYCFILLFFSTSDAIINRFSLLFFWAYVMILSNLKVLVNYNRLRGNIAIIIIFLCFLKANYTFNIELYRYSNIIFEKESYYVREVARSEHYRE